MLFSSRGFYSLTLRMMSFTSLLVICYNIANWFWGRCVIAAFNVAESATGFGNKRSAKGPDFSL
jgi:hypothetical protein